MIEIGFLEIAKDILKLEVLTEINTQLYTQKEALEISFLKQKLKYYVSSHLNIVSRDDEKLNGRRYGRYGGEVDSAGHSAHYSRKQFYVCISVLGAVFQ